MKDKRKKINTAKRSRDVIDIYDKSFKICALAVLTTGCRGRSQQKGDILGKSSIEPASMFSTQAADPLDYLKEAGQVCERGIPRKELRRKSLDAAEDPLQDSGESVTFPAL